MIADLLDNEGLLRFQTSCCCGLPQSTRAVLLGAAVPLYDVLMAKPPQRLCCTKGYHSLYSKVADFTLKMPALFDEHEDVVSL